MEIQNALFKTNFIAENKKITLYKVNWQKASRT